MLSRVRQRLSQVIQNDFPSFFLKSFCAWLEKPCARTCNMSSSSAHIRTQLRGNIRLVASLMCEHAFCSTGFFIMLRYYALERMRNRKDSFLDGSSSGSTRQHMLQSHEKKHGRGISEWMEGGRTITYTLPQTGQCFWMTIIVPAGGNNCHVSFIFCHSFIWLGKNNKILEVLKYEMLWQDVYQILSQSVSNSIDIHQGHILWPVLL